MLQSTQDEFQHPVTRVFVEKSLAWALNRRHVAGTEEIRNTHTILPSTT
jgi:hypothetical protein